MSPAVGRILPLFVVFALALQWFLPDASRADGGSLRKKIHDSKYKWGDYALYLGWHDPADWQFDVHGKSAFPFGLKVRLKWLDWLRLEGDVSYFRRGSEAPRVVSIFNAPELDSFSLATTVQVVRRGGRVRPYVGAGPIFVSIGNDFVAFRRDVWELDSGSPDQFTIASWSQLDVGLEIQAGIEFDIDARVLPFLEYKHLMGELTFGPQDVKLGTLSLAGIGLETGDLETIPDDPAVGGRPYEGKYDWSGPVVIVGLKIRF